MYSRSKQQQGVDYNETFSPVVRYDSLRILLAVAAQSDLEIVQFDIWSAFLYGELEEKIYVKGMKSVDKKFIVKGAFVVSGDKAGI